MKVWNLGVDLVKSIMTHKNFLIRPCIIGLQKTLVKNFFTFFIPEEKNLIVKWRGNPVFIGCWTQAKIQETNAVKISALQDPQTESGCTKRPEWLAILSVCNHLGSVPLVKLATMVVGTALNMDGIMISAVESDELGQSGWDLEIIRAVKGYQWTRKLIKRVKLELELVDIQIQQIRIEYKNQKDCRRAKLEMVWFEN
ncbi:hypothetical protein PPACK8108_LOCUS10201 [Phakopsora pachyrhizi]|uniref:Uncharacterized protein n=1 Tax=Phakopsora pachyrhizi TaxID=170000 RepID=A0AAV0AZU5_PHAPC|nr:hypothetical protein PPACK8108_LOCUS10201 [Phakopsora pachyrhizi]